MDKVFCFLLFTKICTVWYTVLRYLLLLSDYPSKSCIDSSLLNFGYLARISTVRRNLTVSVTWYSCFLSIISPSLSPLFSVPFPLFLRFSFSFLFLSLFPFFFFHWNFFFIFFISYTHTHTHTHTHRLFVTTLLPFSLSFFFSFFLFLPF